MKVWSSKVQNCDLTFCYARQNKTIPAQKASLLNFCVHLTCFFRTLYLLLFLGCIRRKLFCQAGPLEQQKTFSPEFCFSNITMPCYSNQNNSCVSCNLKMSKILHYSIQTALNFVLKEKHFYKFHCTISSLIPLLLGLGFPLI